MYRRRCFRGDNHQYVVRIYILRLGGNLRLFDTNAPRGFLGELCNVRYGSSMYEIGASGVGLNLRRQI